MAQVKSIYMIAICGTGMSALAGLLKQAGYEVSGSDSNIYPPVSTLLANYEIEIKSGYRKENLANEVDLVIIGNAVSKDNEEVQTVLAEGIPYVSFPQALSDLFLKDRKSLVVAGTHGKTTIASLLGWVLHAAGKNPGIMVGGWMKNFESNYHVPQGDYFVVEGDEYDTAFFDKEPKFLHYRPYASILSGIEFDHADIFQDLQHIQSAFQKFVNIINPKGFLLVDESGANGEDVLEKATCVIETYGWSEKATWRIQEYRFETTADGTVQGHFTLTYKGQNVGDFMVPMIGRHNAKNCAAVTAMTIKLGLTVLEINEALEKFKGIKRRQEIIGKKNGVTVIDDFAHHPTAIQQTVEAVKEIFPRSQVWAVFEPRSATSRRAVFQKQFPASFLAADKIIITKLFSPEKIKIEERLDLGLVLSDLHEMGKDAYLIPEVEDIVGFLAVHCENGDAILVMSCGGFNGIHRRLLERL